MVAGLVWLAAGANILRIGMLSVLASWGQGKPWRDAMLPVFILLVLTGFSLMFYRIVGKHEKRMLGYAEEKVSVFLFFDLKGYLMMAFMMGLGIFLRRGSFMPDYFFAFFYTGLGTALSVSGFRFIARFFHLKVRQIVWIWLGQFRWGWAPQAFFCRFCLRFLCICWRPSRF